MTQILRIASISFVLLLFTGCAQISDEQNEGAKKVIEVLALRDSNAMNPTGVVRCGEPRDHLLAEEGYPMVFRTICSVFFDDGESEQRFKDMICIGDFERKPIAESCYVWAPYYPDGVQPEE
jgi:hypothetical protein